MTKIIYLIDQPLDVRNYGRFGIETWITRGWIVEVWDLTALACPRVWNNFAESGHRLAAFTGYFLIKTKRDLDDRVSRIEKVKYFIDLAGDSSWSLRARLRLIHRGVTRVTCATGSIPAPVDEDKRRFASKLKEILSEKPVKSNLARLTNACVNRMAACFIKPGLIVASGEKSVPSAVRGQEILLAHNLDYDIYLRLRTSVDASSAGYGVFLDQNVCFHPDYAYENAPFYATSERYFPAICSGLKTISAVLAAPIKVAAHPRLSRQRKYVDYFEGIPVEFGNTAELIGNCAFVICHFTTAMQFAVLFRKPVIFVTTDELISSAAEKYIEGFASSVGKSVINLNGELGSVDWHKQLDIDSKKYDEYRKKYIKTDGSPDIQHWDIVIDCLEKACGRSSIDPSAQQSASTVVDESAAARGMPSAAQKVR